MGMALPGTTFPGAWMALVVNRHTRSALASAGRVWYSCASAGVAQLVEHLPSKQMVARSSRVARSIVQGIRKRHPAGDPGGMSRLWSRVHVSAPEFLRL